RAGVDLGGRPRPLRSGGRGLTLARAVGIGQPLIINFSSPRPSQRGPSPRCLPEGEAARSNGILDRGGEVERQCAEEALMRPLALGLALLAAMLASATGDAIAQPAQKLVFALNWFAVGDHAAYWVALDKGYYRDKGLDVELQNSKGSGDSIAKVDTGRADIGLADASVVVPRVAQGAKIKVVGAVFDNTTLNIWTRKDTRITNTKDLAAHTLEAPPGDG